MSASATVRRELRGASGVRSLLRSRPDRIAYVGWVGQGNAGDDAIFAAHRRAMSGLHLVAMPLDVGALAAPAVAALHRRRPGGVFRAGLIGGGTLVGRPDWRRRIDFLADLQPRLPIAAVGVGVDDPALSHDSVGAGELERWRGTLARLDSLSVRGPRSQALLRSIGVDAPVSADPALLWARAPRHPEARERLLGLNVAVPRAQIRERDRLVDRAIALGSRARAAGWSVRILAFAKEDVRSARAVARRLPGGAAVITPAAGVEGLLGAIATCHVVYAHRLHAAVLAAAAGVPFLCVDYLPKCGDFLASLELGDWAIARSVVAPDDIGAALDTLATDRDAAADRLHRAVEKRLVPLEAELGLLRNELFTGMRFRS